MTSSFLSPSPDSTDNVAYFSIVGPTKYINITVRWYVSEYFGIKASGIFIYPLLLTTNLLFPLLFKLPLQLPNKLLLHVDLPLA